MGTHTYTTAHSLAAIDKIEEVLQARGGASTWDLALVLGMSQNRVGEYLRHMAKVGTAKCVERARKYQGGTVAARWEPGRTSAEIDEESDDLARVIVIRQEWEPNHVRSQMDCLLFGVPKILQESHA